MHSVTVVFFLKPTIFLLTFYSVTQYFLHVRLCKCQGILVMKICKVAVGTHANTYLPIVNHQRQPLPPHPVQNRESILKIGTGMKEIQ